MVFKEFQSSALQFPQPGSGGLPINDPGTDKIGNSGGLGYLGSS